MASQLPCLSERALYDCGMRFSACLMFLLILTTCTWAQKADAQKAEDTRNLQTGYCPQTRELQAEPSQQFILDGSMGKRHVRMYLDRGGSQVVGLFYYSEGDWEPTALGGDWDGGRVEIDRKSTRLNSS